MTTFRQHAIPESAHERAAMYARTLQAEPLRAKPRGRWWIIAICWLGWAAFVAVLVVSR